MAGVTTWAETLDLIAIELPQCPKAVAMQCAKLAVIEFCVDSGVWLHYPDALDVDAGSRDVVIEPPAGARIAGVTSAQLNGRELDPTTIRDLTLNYSNWQAKAGTPTACWIDENDTLKLFPMPSVAATGGLVCVVWAAPKLTSDSFPAWIWDTHHRPIAAKAKYIAFKMAKKPWSDGNLAIAADGEYRELLADVRSKVARGGGRALLTTTAQFM